MQSATLQPAPRPLVIRTAALVLGVLTPVPAAAEPLVVAKYQSAASLPFVIGLLALGVLLGILAYTLFLAFTTRERMFAYFSVIMTLLTILQTFAAYDRFIFELTYNRVTLITHLLFITFLLFFEDFFSLAANRPRLSRFNRASIWVIAGFTVFFLTVKAVLPGAAALHLVLDFVRELFVFYTNALFLSTIAAAIAWMRTEALIILVAFIPPAVLTSVNAMGIFPFMRRYGEVVGFLMTYNQPIGLSLQAVLFSLAMGNRYNRMKLERRRLAEEGDRLRRLDAEKTEFFMDVSHETRTPLTIILGMTRQLRQGRYGDSVRGCDAALEAIERNSLRLLRQVTHMLRLGRQGPASSSEDIAVAAAVGTMVDEFRAVAVQRGLRLSYAAGEGTDGACLRMARDDFETALMNLLSNALKYTPAGGSVEVAAAADGYGGLAISVADTGPGIAPEHSKGIFERYGRLPADTGYPQTGLGLALVKDVMEGYGGGVTLDSEPGAGSRFTLQFPATMLVAAGGETHAGRPRLADLYLAGLARPGVSAADAGAKDGSTGRPDAPRVLVVEDDEDMRAYVASVLGERLSVTAAASGPEALAALSGSRFDVIVSDVMMPGMDGHAFLREVRRATAEAPVPLVFLTARDSMEERIDSLREGAVRYITKPFGPEMLVAVVDSILAHDRELVGARVASLRRGLDALLEGFERPIPAEVAHSDDAARASAERLLVGAGLSNRERGIADLILMGKSDKEIAAAFGLSPRTVANHNRRIYRKLGVAGRYELIAKAYGAA